jgi:hypothetical protein
MKLKNALIAATLLLSITSAQSALVTGDWKNTGDTLATIDTDTGIEWLDLTLTANQTYNSVIGQLNTTYAGWRLPTDSEMDALLNAYLPSNGPAVNGLSTSYTPSNADHALALDFANKLGLTRDDSYSGAYGLYLNEQGAGRVSGTQVQKTNTHYQLALEMSSAFNPETFSAPLFGTFLVSDGGTTLSSQLDPSINSNNSNAPTIDVSAPALLGLMGLGLFGLASLRRRSSIIKD